MPRIFPLNHIANQFLFARLKRKVGKPFFPKQTLRTVAGGPSTGGASDNIPTATQQVLNAVDQGENMQEQEGRASLSYWRKRKTQKLAEE